jgi:hypothetical protein
MSEIEKRFAAAITGIYWRALREERHAATRLFSDVYGLWQIGAAKMLLTSESGFFGSAREWVAIVQLEREVVPNGQRQKTPWDQGQALNLLEDH